MRTRIENILRQIRAQLYQSKEKITVAEVISKLDIPSDIASSLLSLAIGKELDSSSQLTFNDISKMEGPFLKLYINWYNKHLQTIQPPPVKSKSANQQPTNTGKELERWFKGKKSVSVLELARKTKMPAKKILEKLNHEYFSARFDEHSEIDISTFKRHKKFLVSELAKKQKPKTKPKRDGKTTDEKTSAMNTNAPLDPKIQKDRPKIIGKSKDDLPMLDEPDEYKKPRNIIFTNHPKD